MDVNGDGLPDFVTSTTTTVQGDKQFHTQVRLNTSTNGAVSFGGPTDTLIEDCVSCSFTLDVPDGDAASALRSWDFDGDGRQDLAERTTYLNGNQSVSQWRLLMANGSNFTPVQ